MENVKDLNGIHIKGGNMTIVSYPQPVLYRIACSFQALEVGLQEGWISLVLVQLAKDALPRQRLELF